MNTLLLATDDHEGTIESYPDKRRGLRWRWICCDAEQDGFISTTEAFMKWFVHSTRKVPPTRTSSLGLPEYSSSQAVTTVTANIPPQPVTGTGLVPPPPPPPCEEVPEGEVIRRQPYKTAKHHYDMDRLRDDVDSVRWKKRLQWKQVGEEVGVGPSSLSNFVTGRNQSFLLGTVLAKWMGKNLEDYRRPEIRRR